MTKKYKYKVSAQILNYNCKSFLKDCVRDLLLQDYPLLEIVIVDNASSDESIELIKKEFSNEIKNGKIKIMFLDKNYGFTGGYNRAYKNSNTDYFLLLNADIRITDKRFVSKLIKIISSERNIGSLGVIEIPFGKEIKNVEKVKIGYQSILQTPNQEYLNLKKWEKMKEVLFVGGACCLIRGKFYEELFPEEYFAYGEDTYLGMININKGLKNYITKEAYIFHYGSGSFGKSSPLVKYHSEKNRLCNLLIFYNKKTLIKLIPLEFIYLISSLIFYIRYPKMIRSILNSRIWVLKNLSKMLKKRIILKSRLDENIIIMTSYKIFPENLENTSFKDKKLLKGIYRVFSYILNIFSFFYCYLCNIKTREFKN